MPGRVSQEKADTIAAEYCTNGFIKSLALQAAGLSESYSTHNGLKLFDNDRVKQAVKAKKAEIVAKIEVDFEWLTDKRLAAIQTAEQKKDLGALDRHLQALEKHKGYYEQDNAQRSTKQAILVNVDTSEALEQAIARLRGLKDDRKAIDAEYEDAEDAICKE